MNRKLLNLVKLKENKKKLTIDEKKISRFQYFILVKNDILKLYIKASIMLNNLKENEKHYTNNKITIWTKNYDLVEIEIFEFIFKIYTLLYIITFFFFLFKWKKNYLLI